MIKSDFHLHTSFSSDSTADMEAMIRRGISLGLEHMCFTEHQDMDFPKLEHGLDFNLDTATYREKLLALKDKYKNEIEVLLGVELGLQPHLGGRLAGYASEFPFDFIIGSTHVLEGMDPYEPYYFQKYNTHDGIERYLREQLLNINEFCGFDSLGHLDYIVRCAPDRNSYVPADYDELIGQTLTAVINAGKGLEINTAGLKYGLSHAHPHIEILKRYKKLGGEKITVGSDAHSPEHIAYDFGKAEEMLLECGFKYYTIFRERKAEFVRI